MDLGAADAHVLEQAVVEAGQHARRAAASLVVEQRIVGRPYSRLEDGHGENSSIPVTVVVRDPEIAAAGIGGFSEQVLMCFVCIGAARCADTLARCPRRRSLCSLRHDRASLLMV